MKPQIYTRLWECQLVKCQWKKSVDRGGQRKVKIEQSETTSMKLTLNDGDAFADKLKAENIYAANRIMATVHFPMFPVRRYQCSQNANDVKTEQSETTVDGTDFK